MSDEPRTYQYFEPFLRLIERATTHPRPEVGLVMLQLGAPMMAAVLDKPIPPPEIHLADVFDDAFEAWLVERWLAHVRSAEYRASADYHFLRAEWEQGR